LSVLLKANWVSRTVIGIDRMFVQLKINISKIMCGGEGAENGKERSP
jgi:hypothetical protein